MCGVLMLRKRQKHVTLSTKGKADLHYLLDIFDTHSVLQSWPPPHLYHCLTPPQALLHTPLVSHLQQRVQGLIQRSNRVRNKRA